MNSKTEAEKVLEQRGETLRELRNLIAHFRSLVDLVTVIVEDETASAANREGTYRFCDCCDSHNPV